MVRLAVGGSDEVPDCSYAAMSVLTDEVYVEAEFRIPWGNCGPTAVCSPTGSVVVSVSGGESLCAVVRAARRCSARAWRKR
jgi:hypothetical protein